MADQIQESFYQRLFRIYHRNHRTREVKPETTGQAIALLKDYTGMSWEELARYIGVMPSTVLLMVRRNSKLPIPVCAACERMAHKFNFPVLEKWFGDLHLYMIRHKRRTKSDDRAEERKYYHEIR